MPSKCVYILLDNNNDILYAGQTNRGVDRIVEHLKAHYSNKIKKIRVFDIVNYKDLSKIECLIKHIYDTPLNKNKAPNKKGHSKCPICAIHKEIENELKSIFT